MVLKLKGFIISCMFLNFINDCNVVVDSNLQVRARCVFKVSLEFLSLINFSNNFHNFMILLNLLKSN